jgi:hypothetical protein
MKYSIFAVLIVAGAALAAGSGEARQAYQEIPWTAVRGLHDIVHFPR